MTPENNKKSEKRIKSTSKSPRKPRIKEQDGQGDLFASPSPAPVKSARPKPVKQPLKAEKAQPAAPTRRPRVNAAVREVLPPVEWVPSGQLPYKSFVVLAYVASVLVYDAMAANNANQTINWAVFEWRLSDLQGIFQYVLPAFPSGWLGAAVFREFDLFKLVMWLLIPLLWSLWGMEWGMFSTRRVQTKDWYILAGMAFIGLVAVIATQFIPSLYELYGSHAFPNGGRFSFLVMKLLWVVSWLPAWEFLHRYFLLRRFSTDFPRFGWLVVPLSEGLYHLQKPLLETGGMVVFSLAMTWYVLRRRNLVVPFLAHLFIEVALIFVMLF